MKREPLTVLREVFGHAEFRGPQEQVIHHVVAGGDAIVLAPTGIGKSATFPSKGGWTMGGARS